MLDWITLEKPKETSSDNNNYLNQENKKSISDEFLIEENFEEFYEKKLLQEPWIKNNKYLNKDEIIKNLPSLHYFDNQCSNLVKSLPESTFQSLIKDSNFFLNRRPKK